MKRGQLLGVAIAGVCGLGAFYGVLNLVNKPAKVVTQEVTVSMAQVLVAKTDIGLGQITGPENFRWQDWPQSRPEPELHPAQRPSRMPSPTLTGAVARTPLLPGEPITPMKLVKAGDGGVLAAILPAGMRAMSTRIKEETGVGKLILPNDHVDVLLTTRAARRGDERRRCSATCACLPSGS